jgi:cell wall-associated NlpC family hydrolase
VTLTKYAGLGVYISLHDGLYCGAMRLNDFFGAVFVACAIVVPSAFAAEPPAEVPETQTEPSQKNGVQKMINDALRLVGISYRRGGNDAETGFDCSGFVGYVFREALGMILPRTSLDISRAGTPVPKTELKPGDLVFFHTMRHAFSHVGIYLGGNLFVHAPRPGDAVRVEDLRERYWAKRYNGARRIDP